MASQNDRVEDVELDDGLLVADKVMQAKEPVDGFITEVITYKNGNKITYTYDEEGKPICGSPLRNKTHKRCRNSPAKGRHRCRYHGGKSLRGVNHPNFVDGRYSNLVPDRLTEGYERSRQDPEILALREEIALIEARIGDLLKRVDTGESGATWKLLQKTYKESTSAIRKGDQAEFQEKYAELGKVLNKGVSDYSAWDEIMRSIAARRKLSDSERKRLVDMHQMISTEEALAMLQFIVKTMRTHIKDRQLLKDISEDLTTRLATVSWINKRD